MGQYYNVLITDEKTGKKTVYDRFVDGEYTMAKLMEHSWWQNPFVNTICHKIHFKPKRIAWVGDYSVGELNELAWGENSKPKGVTEAQVILWDKYLVNHSKKEYLDCDEYYEASVEKDNSAWCIHPLPLLTCVGNGGGGGDYRGRNMGYVGLWCNDLISVENKNTSIGEKNKKTEKMLKDYTKISVSFGE